MLWVGLMDVILAFSNPAIEIAIGKLAQAEAARSCRHVEELRQRMRDAVRLVSERGYAYADSGQQALAMAVLILAAADSSADHFTMGVVH